MKWVNFMGREFESDFPFEAVAVPVSRIYGIQRHGEGTIIQLLPGNPGDDSIRMETATDFLTVLSWVS